MPPDGGPGTMLVRWTAAETPVSLLRLNAMEEAVKRRRYAEIFPLRCWEHLAAVDASLAGGPASAMALRAHAPEDRPEAHLRAPANRWRGDFAVSLDLDEAGAGQLELSFIVINDLSAPRHDIDINTAGQVTLLGTAGRNVQEEERALRAGLGPCQVRRGLAMFAELLPRLEEFARGLGYVAIVLEPLTYHNAVMYESYGFSYITGHRRMAQIDREFQRGGRLWKLMDGRSAFRDPALAASARGRSWAIHDGILGDFDGDDRLDLKMVKVIGTASGVRTFHPT